MDSNRKHRGKGVKEAMVHINVRLPKYVVDYFKQSSSYTQAMRKVLEAHTIQADIDAIAAINEENNHE